MNDRRGLLVWGASGHGKVVLECARAMSSFEPVSFIDDAYTIEGEFFGTPVLGTRACLAPALVRQYPNMVIAIGDNLSRAECFSVAVTWGFRLVTVIHPSAVVSCSALLGPGSVVIAGAIINANSTIGSNCIINTGATVGHDCSVGDHVHIAPHVALAGETRIGDYAHIGIGAVAVQQTVVGEHAVVGAGAVLVENVPPHVTVVGVPAHIVRQQARTVFDALSEVGSE